MDKRFNVHALRAGVPCAGTGSAVAAPFHGGPVDAPGFIPWIDGEPHDVPLDTIFNEDGGRRIAPLLC